MDVTTKATSGVDEDAQLHRGTMAGNIAAQNVETACAIEVRLQVVQPTVITMAAMAITMAPTAITRMGTTRMATRTVITTMGTRTAATDTTQEAIIQEVGVAAEAAVQAQRTGERVEEGGTPAATTRVTV